MGRHGRMFGMGGAPVDQEPRPISRATVRRVVTTFRPFRTKVTVVGLMIVVTAGLGVVNPLLIVRVFDQALFAPNNDCAGLHVMQDLRNSLYQHLQKMPLRFFTTTRTGEIQSRLANDVLFDESAVT